MQNQSVQVVDNDFQYMYSYSTRLCHLRILDKLFLHNFAAGTESGRVQKQNGIHVRHPVPVHIAFCEHFLKRLLLI